MLRALGINDVPPVTYPVLGSNTAPVNQHMLPHSQPNMMASQVPSNPAASLANLDFLDSGKLAQLSNLLNGANTTNPDPNNIEKAAKMYRNAAGMIHFYFEKFSN